MLLGYPISEVALLSLWIVAAGVLVGILAGLFGIGGGAIIVPVLYEVFRVLGVPEDVRIQACIGTSLAIIVPTTVRSYLVDRPGSGLSDPVICTGLRVQDRLSCLCQLHRHTHAVRWRALEARRPIARPWHACDLWSYYRAFLVSRRRKRRLHFECSPHALRTTNTSGSGDIGGRGRADHDRRYNWLHACRLAAHGTTAAFVGGLRVSRRAGLDGAGLELHDKLWCTLGALAAASKTGNCIWRFSDSGCATLFRQHDLAGFV